MKVTVLVAHDKFRGIGKEGKLPWHISEDLKFFKEYTTGKHVVMGRTTFESIGKVLPDRKIIILTNNKYYKVEGATVLHSVEEVMEHVANEKADELIVAGGSTVYREFAEHTTDLIITEIQSNYNADTFFFTDKYKDFVCHKSEQHYTEDGIRYLRRYYINLDAALSSL